MPKPLTKNVDVPFRLCFKDKLEKGFTFEELEKRHLKEFQGFLNKVSNMTVDQVDKLYGKRPDKQDNYDGEQVLHYGVTDKFRIHGVNGTNGFMVIRLDPNHRYHP
ncbi:MAG: MAG6450 family protein [Candidatus Ornithospirochaeta sp.]